MSRHKIFWNKEYKKGTHLALSDRPAEDLITFTRWLSRNAKDFSLNSRSQVLDLGCGNGRNLLALNKEFHCKGVGIDISDEALRQAKNVAKGLPLEFITGSIADPIRLPDASADLVIDMMSSHVLRENERLDLRAEVARILKPGGWFLFKAHLSDGDIHSGRLLRHHAADEQGSYIHPKLGVYEHVWSEYEIREFFGDTFEIVKMLRSHKHFINGKVGKRRTVSVYFRKPL